MERSSCEPSQNILIFRGLWSLGAEGWRKYLSTQTLVWFPAPVTAQMPHAECADYFAGALATPYGGRGRYSPIIASSTRRQSSETVLPSV
jgi:hypothetical protein